MCVSFLCGGWGLATRKCIVLKYINDKPLLTHLSHSSNQFCGILDLKQIQNCVVYETQPSEVISQASVLMHRNHVKGLLSYKCGNSFDPQWIQLQLPVSLVFHTANFDN